MAKSYKRGWIKDRNPWAKNQAARKVRRLHWSKDLADGKAYRRLYCPYDISDWCWPVREPGYRLCVHPVDCSYMAKVRRDEAEKWKKRHFVCNGRIWTRK